MKTFGEFVRNKRLARGLSLRQFCERAKIDPSNWSKTERGRAQLTQDRETLERIAKLLKIKEGTSEWSEFFDLAVIAQGVIPKELYSDDEVLGVLPIFFRTVSGESPSKEELNKLIEVLKKR